jgi:hypothetical protein
MTASAASAAPQGAPSRLPGTWWAVCALLAVLAGFAVTWSSANSDSAWYLYMAGRVLHGATMYVDVVDTNPPLIVWLTLPPAWLAGAGLPGIAALNGYLFALALLSIGATAALSARVWGSWPASARGLAVAGVAFVVLPYVGADFGQREHLTVLATLPYMLAAMAWLQRRPPGIAAACVIGAVGGLGFAIKPYYAAGWAGIELVLAIAGRGRSRWRRPELIAAVLTIAGYGLAILLFAPQYLPFARVVHAVYGGFDASWLYLLRLHEIRLWLVCLVALAAVRLPARSRHLCAVVFAVETGFLLAALVQMKGWTYHLYPARALAVLFLLLFALSVLDAVPQLVNAVRGGIRVVALGAALVLAGWSAQYVREARAPRADLVASLDELVTREAPGGRLAQLSTRTIIWPSFPVVVQQRLGWSLSHNSLWFLPGLYQQQPASGGGAVSLRTPDSMPPLERKFFDRIVSDLCAAPPDLLLVESALEPAPAGQGVFDLDAYYGQDERYRVLLGAYQRRDPLGPFEVFKRVAPATCRGTRASEELSRHRSGPGGTAPRGAEDGGRISVKGN